MKKIFIILLLAISLVAEAAKYYCAPTTATPAGSDANAGTISAPFFTLDRAWDVVSAGDTIYLRGGTYINTARQDLTGKSGTSGNMINVWAYPNESPVFTDNDVDNYGSWPPSYIYFSGNYVHWKGIEWAYIEQRPGPVGGGWCLWVNSSNNNIFELLEFHHCNATLSLYGNSTGNLILNCDSHHNQDPYSIEPYEHADGISVHYITAGCSNIMRGCRMWWNADDGLDMIQSDGYLLIENCWSWYNGYIPDTFTAVGNGMGFKLGNTVGNYNTQFLRTVRNNVAFHNRRSGFDQNLANCKMYVYNNISYDNRNDPTGSGFMFAWYDLGHIIRNNVSFGNRDEDYYGTHTNAIIDHNSYDALWQPSGVAATSADFISVTPTGMDGARQPDGSLPSLYFLKLAATSDLINAGVDVGLAYIDSAPDLGAYETQIHNNYYVKVGGSDAADGLTDATAWATLTKVNSSIASGDSVFFKRGDNWRGQLIPVTGVLEGHTYYGAYGTGNKPLILGSERKNSTGDWTNVSGNIWTTAAGSFTLDIGNLIFNGEASCGVKIMSATPTLDAQGEFWYDFTNDLIRMYSVGNPATFYTDIECAKNGSAIYHSNKSYVTYQNLDIRYTGAHGIGTSSGSHHVNVFDCDFSFIGGSDQTGVYTTRYGNGVEFWQAANNCYVERCTFDNIYDAAITPQGDVGTYAVTDLYFRNNIITNAEYSYELFWHDVSATATRVYFENNTCALAGGGFGHLQRPGGVVQGYHVRMGTNDATCSNVVIRNNIFYLPTEAVIYYHSATHLAKVNLDYNNYYVGSGVMYGYRSNGGTESTYTLATWQTLSIQEANAVDGNPTLRDVANYDFHLTASSNVIGQGVTTSSTTDFDGVSWNIPRSIGAYEFAPSNRGFISSGAKLRYQGKYIKYGIVEETYTFPKSIIWFSDFHFGSTNWTTDELNAALVGLNSQPTELYLASGDQIETTGDATQTAGFNALMSGLNDVLYTLRGNHDGGQFTQHFVIEMENVVIIAFYASYYTLAEPPPYNNTGDVSDAEITWLTTQLAAYSGKRIILMCHYPMTDTLWGHIVNGHGREEIVALMNLYNIKLYLSGHVHGGNALTNITDTESTQEINTFSGGTPGKFTLITIYADRIVFTPYNLYSPYSVSTPVQTLYF